MIIFDREDFSSIELVIVEALSEHLSSIFDEGKIIIRWDTCGGMIRVECPNKDNELFILQLLVSEENNSLNLTSILIPHSLAHQGIGTNLVTAIMNTSKEVGLDLFITDFANERWRDNLIKNGAILYEGGSVLIEQGEWKFN